MTNRQHLDKLIAQWNAKYGAESGNYSAKDYEGIATAWLDSDEKWFEQEYGVSFDEMLVEIIISANEKLHRTMDAIFSLDVKRMKKLSKKEKENEHYMRLYSLFSDLLRESNPDLYMRKID